MFMLEQLPLDIRQQEIKIGSTIVYPGRRSSSLWLNVGVVEEMIRTTYRGNSLLRLRVNRFDRYTGKTKSVLVECLGRVAVVC